MNSGDYVILPGGECLGITAEHYNYDRRFPRSMHSQGKRPGRGSRQACRPQRHFHTFLFRKETLTRHYFIFKFDLSLGIRTNMGKLKEFFSIYNVIVTE